MVKTFQKCNTPDLKYYLSMLANKISPCGVMLFLSLFSMFFFFFVFFFCLFYNYEKRLKINITQYWEMLLVNLLE